MMSVPEDPGAAFDVVFHAVRPWIIMRPAEHYPEAQRRNRDSGIRWLGASHGRAASGWMTENSQTAHGWSWVREREQSGGVETIGSTETSRVGESMWRRHVEIADSTGM